MGSSKAGACLRRYLILGPFCSLLFLHALLSGSSRAADITLSSRTYLLAYERDALGDGDRTVIPLYEYLAADARTLGGKPVSLHLYGWGRLDLGDDPGRDRGAGEVASAYLQYVHPTGNAQARLGRFFLAEGAAAEILDGLFVKVPLADGLGISVFAGAPVEQSALGSGEGDSLYGGRLFLVRSGFAEIGVSYLKETGDFRGEDREVAGIDLWVRPPGWIELSGRAAYNLATEGLASQRYVLRLLPRAGIDIAAGYEHYAYGDLFQPALNPAFLTARTAADDEVSTLFAILGWDIGKGFTLEAAVKNIRHDLGDPGNAVRGEVGLRYSYNDRKDVAGLSGAMVSADRPENEYDEYRAFASYSPGKMRLTLDALLQRYGAEFPEYPGTRTAYQIVGSAGYEILPYMRLSGDLRYTESPRFEEDLAALVRVTLATNPAAGGSR